MAVFVMTSLLLLLLVPCVSGHGRFIQPPGRSSAWRYGFATPPNYNDNELNCGGMNNQWESQGGKCGLCGDPYQGPRENEAGGKYATGTIVDTYTSGSLIEVTVQITANHMGWHEFRLCKNDNPDKAITQQCLDEHLLQEAGTGETRLFMHSSVAQNYMYTLQLPAGLTCSQCVMQWKWHCGNNWGVDQVTGESGIGFGPQEEFYGCSDVTITGAASKGTTNTGHSSTAPPTTRQSSTAPPTTRQSSTAPPTTRQSSTAPPTTRQSSTAPPTTRQSSTAPPTTRQSSTAPPTTRQSSTAPPTTRQSSIAPPTTRQSSTAPPTTRHSSVVTAPSTTTNPPVEECHAIGAWKDSPGMDDWCEANCFGGYCPADYCECTLAKYSLCMVRSQYAAVEGVAAWCELHCARGHCPRLTCHCQ